MSQWSDGGHYNFGAAVQFALDDGRNWVDGRQLGAPTGEPRRSRPSKHFKDAVKAQLRLFIRHIAIANLVAQKAHAVYLPKPLSSALVEGCVETGGRHHPRRRQVQRRPGLHRHRHRRPRRLAGRGQEARLRRAGALTLAELVDRPAARISPATRDRAADADQPCAEVRQRRRRGGRAGRVSSPTSSPSWWTATSGCTGWPDHQRALPGVVARPARQGGGRPALGPARLDAAGRRLLALPRLRHQRPDGRHQVGGQDRPQPAHRGHALNMKLNPELLKDDRGLDNLAALIRSFFDAGRLPHPVQRGDRRRPCGRRRRDPKAPRPDRPGGGLQRLLRRPLQGDPGRHHRAHGACSLESAVSSG